MNSSGPTRYKDLAREIMGTFAQISQEFSSFQTSSKLGCIEGCGKCCFKPDIYCSPIELLPLALELLEKGEAQTMYDSILDKQDDRCAFLNVNNEEKYLAQCTMYNNRPLICRTFGVSARHGKSGRVDLSVCKPLQETKPLEYEALVSKNISPEELPIPFIDVCKSRLTTIDPLFSEEELPINQALKIILEKVLFYSAYENAD